MTKKNIIKNDLNRAEKLEEDLISLYFSMLDYGVEKCFPAEKQEEVLQSLDVLKNESSKHKQLILSLSK